MKTVLFRHCLALILLFFWVQQVKGQVLSNFYIEPVIGTKCRMNHLLDKKNPLETAYFKLEPIRWQLPYRFTPLLLGVNFGYEFKNSDRLQFGISMDEAAEGYRLYGLSYNGDYNRNSYSNVNYIISTGSAVTNFSLIYKRKILTYKSSAFNEGRYLQVLLHLGVNYFFKPNKDIQPQFSDGFGYTAFDSSIVNIHTESYAYPINFRNALKYRLGLDFVFGKNNKEWFNLNLSIAHSTMNNWGHSLMKVYIEVSKNNDTKYYFYEFFGKGNGIYLSLSKKIYPFRLFNKNNQKNKH
jgi:hypothetical protein